MGAGRDVWVKIRASEAERAEWHAKARRVRTWTVAYADVEREGTRQVAHIGTNHNRIARWANVGFVMRSRARASRSACHVAVRWISPRPPCLRARFVRATMRLKARCRPPNSFKDLDIALENGLLLPGPGDSDDLDPAAAAP